MTSNGWDGKAIAAGTTANKPADTTRSTVHNVECLPLAADCNGADADMVREIYLLGGFFYVIRRFNDC